MPLVSDPGSESVSRSNRKSKRARGYTIKKPAPSTSSGTELEIHLLGSPEFRRGTCLLPSLPTRKTQSLLVYLVLRRDRSRSRDELATLFWGEQSDVRARRSLATALWSIRRLLVDDVYLLTDSTSIQFNPASPFWLDVAEFERYLTASRDEKHAADCLRKAVDLYRGDLLEGLYDDWCIEERCRLEASYLDALTRLVAWCETQGDARAVVAYACNYLTHDSLAENIHLSAMRAFVALGDRVGARHQWELCCRVRQQELHASPSPKVLEEAERILGAHFILPLPIKRVPLWALPRHASLDRPPFVGRTLEMDALGARWKQADEGKGGVVLISGEAGVGKSRLAEEFAAMVPWRGGVVARGRCCEPERVLLYQPLTEILRDLLATKDEHEAPALPAWACVELARLIPEIATPPTQREFPPDDPRRERQAILFHAIATSVRHFALQMPLIIVLEDLHWATDSTIAGLHYLARQVSDMRALIVGTFRPEELGSSHPLMTMMSQLAREGLAEHLPLERLSADAVAELIFHLSAQVRDLHKSNVEPERVNQLYAHTEGNALFLIETLRELGEVPSREATLPVPSTVRALIRTRLDRLNASTRELVACAAVAGRAFKFDLVCRAGGMSEEEALDAIDELLRRGFLREGSDIAGHDYEFAHSLTHQAVYTSLNHRRRRRLHRIIGETLESLYDEPRGELVGTLAHHFEAGGKVERALHYRDLSAQRAKSLFAWQEAEEHQTRMLELLDRLDPDCRQLDLRMQRGQVLADRAYQRFLQGRLAERDADLSALAALAEASRDERLSMQTLAHQVRYLNLDGQYTQAIAVGEKGMTLANQFNDISAQCHFLTQIGFAHYFRGEYEAAQQRLQAALALEPPDPSVRGEILSVLSYASYLVADYQRSLDYRQQSLAIRSNLGQVDREALDRTDMGILYTRINRLKDAEKYLSDALALARKIGSQVAESYVLNNLGNLYYLRGDLPAALNSSSQSLALQRATGSRRGEASALANSGMTHVALGDYAAAESLLRQSLAIQEDIGYQSGLAEGLAHLARALAGLGRLDEALATAKRSLEVARRIGDRSCQATALNVLAWLQLVNEEPEPALALSNEATSLAEETGLVHGRVLGLTLTGLAHLKLGHPSQAHGYTSQAVNLLREQDCIEGPEEAVYLAHSLVLTALGWREDASDALREAEAQLNAKADRISDPQSRQRYLDSWTLRSLPRL